MKKQLLITGGTGLIGTHLTALLQAKGYQISYLSRSQQDIPQVKVYQWDIPKQQIESGALASHQAIIHLAGAGVADQRWTESRKQTILKSRTESTRLLRQELEKLETKPKAFLSASAIGIYGNDTGEAWMKEDAPSGDDFLAEVTKQWEDSVDQIAELGIRTVKLRIGVVLSEKGGALEKIAQPIKLGAGAALGSGKQYLSWIHIDDLCQMFIHALENEAVQGVFNAVGPHPATNAEFTKATAQVLNRPLILPNVPSFALKLMLGEMASIVLGGNRVSSEKIQAQGFQFQYPTLKPALQDLLP